MKSAEVKQRDVMRPIHSVIAMSVAAALLAVAPAWAESRASLSDRVSALETRLQQNQNQQSVEQLNRIAQLETDIKSLRSIVEALQNENAQLKQRSQDLYVDLDGRLSRLEGGGAGSAPRPIAAGPIAPAMPASSGSLPPPVLPVAPADPVAEKQAYDGALAAVTADHSAEAARRFQAFVQQYPNSPLAPNAWYWLGESYYVTQNYQLALDAFLTVVKRFPDSPKAPGALLKLGYSQDGLKQHDAAVATLRDLIQRYPRSEAANQAQSRLRLSAVDAER